MMVKLTHSCQHFCLPGSSAPARCTSAELSIYSPWSGGWPAALPAPSCGRPAARQRVCCRCVGRNPPPRLPRGRAGPALTPALPRRSGARATTTCCVWQTWRDCWNWEAYRRVSVNSLPSTPLLPCRQPGDLSPPIAVANYCLIVIVLTQHARRLSDVPHQSGQGRLPQPTPSPARCQGQACLCCRNKPLQLRLLPQLPAQVRPLAPAAPLHAQDHARARAHARAHSAAHPPLLRTFP
jgi:hypothetical protein